MGPQYPGGTGGALLCCSPALLSWANHWLSLGLSFLIWEMRGLDQVNPKSTVSGNILGYLNSLRPNFVQLGEVIQLSRAQSSSHPSLTSCSMGQDTELCPTAVCIWYEIETTAALLPCLVEMPNCSLSHRKKKGGKNEIISHCTVFPRDTFSNFISGLTV